MRTWSFLAVVYFAVAHAFAGRDPGSWSWAPTTHDLSLSIEADLGRRLSRHASILLPTSSNFTSLEIRASSPRIEPHFSAIVEVATEADVQQTVCELRAAARSRI
jgi:hypothetical protein